MNSSNSKSGVDLLRQIVTLVAILATFTINILSNFFPPEGLNIGEIANTVLSEVQVLPASYAFAIWGLIYLGLIAYGVYQLLPSQRHDPTLRRVDYLLIVACIAQIVWVYLFTTRSFWLSVLAILVILLSLIGAYQYLRGDRRGVLWQEKWLALIPFSIYLGWISVATIVNVASALYVSGWNGWGIGTPVWASFVLLVGAVIAAIAAVQRNDNAFTLVFIWAYVAIAVRQSDQWLILATAGLAAIALAVILIANQFTGGRSASNR